jgi:CubicO group peptidase (beta-lactamase class C family)
MLDTTFLIPPEKAKRFARALRNDPDTGKPQASADNTKPYKFECGGGCAASTRVGLPAIRPDAAQPRQARRQTHPCEPHRRLHDGQPPHARHANYIADADPTKAGYEFGLTMAVRTSAGGPGMMGSTGTYGWSGASGTEFWVDPKEQLVVVFMSAGPGPIRWHYRRVINALVYQSLID